MPRLFVAIRPTATIVDRLLAIQGAIEGARWQDDEQLHLTLRYIGEVDHRTANDVVDLLGAVRARPFDIALGDIGSFERKGRIGSLWAGVTPHDAVTALHRKIDHALVRLGLPPEGRAYRPHITLARFGRGAGPIAGFVEVHGGLTSAPFAVDSFTLYESHLGDAGSTYEVVADYALG